MSSPSSSASSSPRVPARQSVRDLLAELSDSDSDLKTSESSKPKAIVPESSLIEEESSEDDVLARRGGKLARRLAGKTATSITEVVQADEQQEDLPSESAGEDLDRVIFGPTRKLLIRKKSTRLPSKSPTVNDVSSRSLSPAASPFSSRSDKSSTSSTRSVPALTQKLNQVAESNNKSRFNTLVEKARAQRVAREEEERAKKEAIRAQESPAATEPREHGDESLIDELDAESDVSEGAAAKRLTKSSRPTRKASKKALEEMNRETQRMNRNMQLAHQAKTKRKFTKESFFASFVHDLPATNTNKPQKHHPSSPESLSAASIMDGQRSRQHSTPPTSPLSGSEAPKQTDPGNESIGPSLLDTAKIMCPDLILPVDNVQPVAKRVESKAGQLQAKLNARVAVARIEHDLSSDSDLEVIADRASKRKYAAFENLPKKKAKEKPSHLALRSLANIRREKSTKSAIAPADMGPALLRAARKQAQDERQAKIERLKAAGVVIQTVEEREKEEEELEDLVEKARQEDEEIRKREKQMAKKDGTFKRDILDDDEDSDEEDEDFVDQISEGEHSASESDDEGDDVEDEDEQDLNREGETTLFDEAAIESAEASEGNNSEESESELEGPAITTTPIVNRVPRHKRVIEDEDEDEVDQEADKVSKTPFLPTVRKTPQSIMLSARKIIPGLQFSDDLPIGLTQAFAATMAESQTQDEAAEELEETDLLSGLPSPKIDMVPQLQRLDSVDVIAESIAGSQVQSLGLGVDLPQSQRVPESPVRILQYTASQPVFELTQDNGYKFSPFAGSRFTETPGKQPYSTEETIILDQVADSPIVQRQGRLRRGQQTTEEQTNASSALPKSAFTVMDKAAKKRATEEFNRKRSEARQAIDEAAEESDDEYAGLGGVSGEDTDEEADEEDRKMIDEDTQIGRGDEAKLAKLHADRERESDEAAVSKLLKDITTGALRRKRGPGDDLDLSDEEDNAAQRRKAKQREFEKMRRALLKDEAIGKIAEDKRKEAFLKSIEDRDEIYESDNELTEFDSQQESGPQGEVAVSAIGQGDATSHEVSQQSAEPLQTSKDSRLNKFNFSIRGTKTLTSRKPATLAEIRESVSFLVEEPDSQAQTIHLELSDSEDEPEAYINLDRHFQQAEADENAEEDDTEDMGDFIVDDQPPESASQDDMFKKPDLPGKQMNGDRAPFSERRTKAANIVDRLSLLRQASSSSTGTSNASSRMAFFTSKASTPGVLSGGPSLLRRATTNSSLGSSSGRDNVSATGVVTSKTERGSAKEEKEFVRKGSMTSRNAVNYQGRQNLKEEKMSARAGVVKRQQKKKGGSGFLSGLLRGDAWA